MRVSAIMQTDLVTTAPDAAVVDVARLLTERRVGACLVMEGGELAGIFTERDLVRLVSSGSGRAPPPGPRGDDDRRDARRRRTPTSCGRRRRCAGSACATCRSARAATSVGIISIRDLYAAAEAVLRLDPRGAETARGVLAAASH